MSGRGRPREAGRETTPRHIRSVADHFLGPSPAQPRPAPAAEPGRGGEPARSYSFAVAAAGDGRLAAQVAAGLAWCTLPGKGGGRAAAGGPGLRVWLEDRHAGPWAAWTFLAAESGGRWSSRRGPELDRGPAAGRAGLVGESSLPAASPAAWGGADPVAAAVAVQWLNLGCVDGPALSRWETAGPSPGAAAGGAGAGGDGLVWCLRAAEAGRLAAAYRLGRLLQALAPTQLKLLVFPSVRSDNGAPADEAAAGAASAAALNAAVRLARARAAPVVPAGCVWEALAALETWGGGGEAIPGGAFTARPVGIARRVYAPLVASLEQGAATRRRASATEERACAAVE